MSNHLSLPRVLFAALLLLNTSFLQAQDNSGGRDSNYIRPIDTTLSENGQMLARLERMNNVLNRVSNAVDQNFDTKDIDDGLPSIATNIGIIQSSLDNPNTLTLRNLQLFQVTVQDMLTDLRNWRTTLADYNRQLISMDANIDRIVNDTSSKAGAGNDKIRELYLGKIAELKQKLVIADSMSNAGLGKIDQLQSLVSDNFLAAVSLRRDIRQQLKKFSSQAFSQEYPYLWQASTQREKKGGGGGFRAERKIMQYYFSNSKEGRTDMLIIGLIFFVWVVINFRYLTRRKMMQPGNYTLHFLRAIPFFATCVVVLSLSPFFDLHPPANYVAFLQFLLLVALTFLLSHTWPRKLLYCWIGFVVIFLLFAATRLLFHDILAQRWWYILINILSIVAGLAFYPRIGKSWSLNWLIKPVVVLFLVLNVLAIMINVSGRLTLTEIFTTAAIFGITQVIGLTVFMQIILEAIYLQVLRLRKGNISGEEFDFEKFNTRVKKILSILCLVLWLIVFTTNINMYDTIYSSIVQFLRQRRMIGSTGFTFGSIALFFLIIYLANLFQQHIGYFWDRGRTDLQPLKKSRIGSRLLFTRLILLTVGFLIAVAASGLPLDKITIILGALGVGIGLGLQNIVNNLVSGIVLIFERPLEVGDWIEVRDKKGVVKEIGLRSSTIVSDEGSEIIIPNGDFLSEHVINWTLSNNLVKLEVTVYVKPDVEMEHINKLILDTLAANEHVYQKFPPSVIVDNVNNKRLRLKIQFWYTDIRQVDEMKGEVLESIRIKFQANQIDIV